MHFQTKFIRGVSVALCALLLSFSVVTSYSIPVYASESTDSSLTKLVDMALTKTGIVANEEILTDLADDILYVLNGALSNFETYCTDNSVECNRTNYLEWLNSGNSGYSDSLVEILTTETMIDLVFPSETEMNLYTFTGIVPALLGAKTIVAGAEYKLTDTVVDWIRSLFDEETASGSYGYYYVDTLSPKEIPSSWFNDATSYANIQQYVTSSEYPTLFHISFYYSPTLPGTTYSLYDNSTNVNIVRPYEECTTTTFYNDDWTLFSKSLYKFNYGTQISVCDSESYITVATGSCINPAYATYLYPSGMSDTNNIIVIASKDGNKQVVYTSLDALKQYSLGNKPYYQVTNTTYDTSTDNSVEFTGDYYNDNSSTYAYDIVQNEIDNSSVTTDNSVNNIVNDSSTTIINNYYTTGTSDSVSGDDSDTTLGEGIEKFFTGITELLDFLLGILGDAVNLITSFVDSAYTLLSGLTGTFGNFSSLLGEMFAFIPQELMDAITAGITLLIVVAVAKAIKG